MTTAAPANVVLVHGGCADGSGWQGVYNVLRQDGYNVSVVQNPTLSLEGDAAAARQVIGAQDGPVVLVGHSYGGAVITEAGTGDNVAALVYIAAFAPDSGESVNTLTADPPPGAPVPPILPAKDGFLFLDREKFHASYAADLPAEQAAFMADSQVPFGVDAVSGTITDPAWRARPSWYMITTEDRMIPPAAQRAMSRRAGSTVTEVSASHAVCISQPAAVAGLIEQAAEQVTTQAKSLYGRLGGLGAVNAAVDSWVARVAGDGRVNQKFVRTDIPRLKKHVVDLLCQATGGPCTYTGRDTRERYDGMKVTAGEFDAVMQHLAATLDELNVPGAEQDELVGLLMPMRPEIVEVESPQTGTPLPDSYQAAPPLS